MRVESTILNIAGCNNFTDKFVKSSLMPREQNYASLPYNPAYFHPSFGMRNPKAAMYRTTQLSAKYAEKGFRYLLPHEVWSDGKILQTVRDFGKTLDELANNNLLNKETFQEAVNKILPEHAKGKIVIKDFSELQQNLRREHYDEAAINNCLANNALIENQPQYSTLYLRFRNFTNNFEKVNFEVEAQHELKHALSFRLQNTLMCDIYKNNFGECQWQNAIFDRIKQFFDHLYCCAFDVKKTELTQQSMLKEMGFASVNELHEDFENSINVIIGKAKSSGKLTIDSNEGWKQFFSYLRHYAKDEKEAYQTNIRHRELLGDQNDPSATELVSLFYGEVEKFFANKEQALVRAGAN